MQLGFDWTGLFTNVAQAATQVYSAKQDVKNKIAVLKAQQEADAKTAKILQDAQALQVQRAAAALNPAPSANPAAQVSHAKLMPPTWLLPVTLGALGLLVTFATRSRK